MKSFYPKRLSKKWKTFWVIIQLTIVGVGYYLFVYKSYGYKSYNDLIGGMMVMLGIVLSLMAFIDSPYTSKWYEAKSLKFYIPMIVLLLGAIFLLIANRNDFYEKEATIPTFAEVIRKQRVNFFSRKRGNRVRKYAIIRYFDQGQEVIQRISDEDNRFTVGDYIPIKYSMIRPELFRIENEFEE